MTDTDRRLTDGQVEAVRRSVIGGFYLALIEAEEQADEATRRDWAITLGNRTTPTGQPKLAAITKPRK